ncbi:MAG: ATP-binding cassette domain-containing protein [Propionibacteriaceae bacterium]|jgi:energy-coupling factor transport system ATP-binding protein|nr:ATP-binding cassette domain-containing protein [Propionibacteriaceae bacterium]
MALIQVEQLSFAFPNTEQDVLHAVSFELAAGEFALLIGQSGCGKTTLLKHLKTALTPYGTRSGAVRFDGRPLGEVPQAEQARRIGFVLQNPDNQIVTDKVWHELAFGLESLGTPSDVIRRRVAEMASFFGIGDWYHRNVDTLSGGQKQLLNLAAVMTMQPDLLLLDEPTAQLDPIAAVDFLAATKRINDEIGTTVLVTEHRLETAFPLADRVLTLNDGRLVADEPPRTVGLALVHESDPMVAALPAAVRLSLALDAPDSVRTSPECAVAPPRPAECPVSIREGRAYLARKLDHAHLIAEPGHRLGFPESKDVENAVKARSATEVGDADGAEPIISARDLWFRYSRGDDDVLRGVDLTVRQGEFACLVGGNGSGKTTTLRVLSGLHKPYRGKVRLLGLDPTKAKGMELTRAGLAVLPQDPQTLFMRNTIGDDLDDVATTHFPEKEERAAMVASAAAAAEITELLERHPYDVSGGEQQRAALALALLTRPKLLLLDEPTKGMDAFFKAKLAGVLRRLIDQGLSILMVSHDVEFAAEHASRCLLFFDGVVVTEGVPREFFSGNSFYTTAANRMSRGLVSGAITVSDLVERIQALPAECTSPESVPATQRDAGEPVPEPASQKPETTTGAAS